MRSQATPNYHLGVTRNSGGCFLLPDSDPTCIFPVRYHYAYVTLRYLIGVPLPI